MLGLLKILAAFAAIVFMVRKKVNLGTAMLIGSILLALFSGAGRLLFRSGSIITPCDFLMIVWQEVSSSSTLKLVGIVVLVLILSHCLEVTGQMNQILRTFQALARDARLLLVTLPALIGLLPMPGGAVFSAPMVEESQKELNLTPTKKTLINFWFRHIWEYSWPLYPGILLAAGLARKAGLDLSVFKLAIIQSPLTAAALVGGILFILRGIPRAAGVRRPEKGKFQFAKLALDLSPILVIIALVVLLSAATGMESEESLLAALVPAIVLTLAIGRAKRGMPLLSSLKKISASHILKLVYMIMGLMVFRGTIPKSGAVTEISAMMKAYHVPLLPFIVTLSFLAGLVTGLTMAYVGMLFPIFTPLILQVTSDPLPFLVLAFGSGFIGVLFSPVHVCLIVTHHYFKSGFSGVYRGMLAPAAVIFATLIALFLVLYLTPLSG